jgi:hypothetical protein
VHETQDVPALVHEDAKDALCAARRRIPQHPSTQIRVDVHVRFDDAPLTVGVFVVDVCKRGCCGIEAALSPSIPYPFDGVQAVALLRRSLTHAVVLEGDLATPRAPPRTESFTDGVFNLCEIETLRNFRIHHIVNDRFAPANLGRSIKRRQLAGGAIGSRAGAEHHDVRKGAYS